MALSYFIDFDGGLFNVLLLRAADIFNSYSLALPLIHFDTKWGHFLSLILFNT